MSVAFSHNSLFLCGVSPLFKMKNKSNIFFYILEIFCFTKKINQPLDKCLTRLTRRVSLVEQELLTLPEHISSPN